MSIKSSSEQYHSEQLSCFTPIKRLSTGKKIAITALVIGVAIGIFALIAFFVPFPGGLSFFNQHIVKIVTATIAGVTVGTALIYLIFKRVMHNDVENLNSNVAEDNKDPKDVNEATDNSPSLPDPFNDKVELETKKFINDLKGALRDKGSEFQFKYGLLCKKLKKSRADLQSMNEEGWNKLEKKVKNWIVESYAHGEYENPISVKWVTGTSSPTLVGMSLVAEKKHTQNPALVPTGQLLKWNIVPLTGELAWGILPGRVNITALSGAPFSSCDVAYDYSTMKNLTFTEKDQQSELQFILDCNAELVSRVILRLKIAVLRLIHSGASAEMLARAREHIERTILPKMKPALSGWENLARLIGSNTENVPSLSNAANHALPRGEVVGVPRSDGSFKFALISGYNKETDSYSVILDARGTTKTVESKKISVFDKNTLEIHAQNFKALSPEAMSNIQNMLADQYNYQTPVQEILDLFTTEHTLKLSEQEKTLMENPFPIVWGVTEESKAQFFPVHADIVEWGHEGILQLGSDVKVVFTKKKKFTLLNQWLEEKRISSVRVLSLGAMAYLHAANKVT